MQRLPTRAIKEVNLCVGVIQAGGQRQSGVWRVDRDEETTMFGERTGESNANLYPANWKQQSPAPEPHSRPCGQHWAWATWEGDEGQGDGEMGWRLGSVSMAALLFLSLQTGQRFFGVCVCMHLERLDVRV